MILVIFLVPLPSQSSDNINLAPEPLFISISTSTSLSSSPFMSPPLSAYNSLSSSTLTPPPPKLGDLVQNVSPHMFLGLGGRLVIDRQQLAKTQGLWKGVKESGEEKTETDRESEAPSISCPLEIWAARKGSRHFPQASQN